jgi:hypothetical protein
MAAAGLLQAARDILLGFVDLARVLICRNWFRPKA